MTPPEERILPPDVLQIRATSALAWVSSLLVYIADFRLAGHYNCMIQFLKNKSLVSVSVFLCPVSVLCVSVSMDMDVHINLVVVSVALEYSNTEGIQEKLKVKCLF